MSESENNDREQQVNAAEADAPLPEAKPEEKEVESTELSAGDAQPLPLAETAPEAAVEEAVEEAAVAQEIPAAQESTSPAESSDPVEAKADSEEAKADSEEAEADDEAPTGPALGPDGKPMKWYVVHTYSGYENKANRTLTERIKREKLDDHFGQILVPTEEVVEIRKGKRRTSKRKFFPGYMLVQMAMTESSWYLVKSTPKITGFVGDSTNPMPVPEAEIAAITSQLVEGAERVVPKIIYDKGDLVRVMDGPFANFNGTVEDVDSEKGKLRVLVSIFGRATPVEMDFMQVEKT